MWLKTTRVTVLSATYAVAEGVWKEHFNEVQVFYVVRFAHSFLLIYSPNIISGSIPRLFAINTPLNHVVRGNPQQSPWGSWSKPWQARSMVQMCSLHCLCWILVKRHEIDSLKMVDPENNQFLVKTNLPTLTGSMLIYWRVITCLKTHWETTKYCFCTTKLRFIFALGPLLRTCFFKRLGRGFRGCRSRSAYLIQPEDVKTDRCWEHANSSLSCCVLNILNEWIYSRLISAPCCAEEKKISLDQHFSTALAARIDLKGWRSCRLQYSGTIGTLLRVSNFSTRWYVPTIILLISIIINILDPWHYDMFLFFGVDDFALWCSKNDDQHVMSFVQAIWCRGSRQAHCGNRLHAPERCRGTELQNEGTCAEWVVKNAWFSHVFLCFPWPYYFFLKHPPSFVTRMMCCRIHSSWSSISIIIFITIIILMLVMFLL